MTMLGLNEKDLEIYLDCLQEFSRTTIMDLFNGVATMLMPVKTHEDGTEELDQKFSSEVVKDVETVVVITSIAMGYEYAHLQLDPNKEEYDIIHHLDDKYDGFIVNQLLKYGLVFTTDIVDAIKQELIMELPYIYQASQSAEDFDPDEFLDIRLPAHEMYMDEVIESMMEEDLGEE